MSNKKQADKFIAIWLQALQSIMPQATTHLSDDWEWNAASVKPAEGYIPLVDGGGDYVLSTSIHACIEAGFTGLVKGLCDQCEKDAYTDAVPESDKEEFIDDWLEGYSVAFKFRVCFYEQDGISNSFGGRDFPESYLHFDCWVDPSEYQQDKNTIGSCRFSIKMADMTEAIARGIAIKQADYFKTTILGLK